MKTALTMVAIAALSSALAGCGGNEPLGMKESLDIAGLSQDAPTYKNEFALAIRDLSAKDQCQPEAMREQGGFSKVTGSDFYFIYCSEQANTSSRWYYDPANGKLSQDKSEVRG
ncbi:hypothetical protein BTW08_15300 [Salinicola sp. MH3R3-1]|uniref:hypothetical protein n=1 Tax=Salinicola sp. MH3R3-1 TaxID=1928762 RepID=UPI00094EFFCC|nr:hypothetical protein [Salinicola sp. MH3R3-1]OLO06860.1 hypothetical protein BTW08_15300 [Salinicola sp. MH3R3-1]